MRAARGERRLRPKGRARCRIRSLVTSEPALVTTGCASTTIALLQITLPAQELEISHVVDAALCQRNHVVEVVRTLDRDKAGKIPLSVHAPSAIAKKHSAPRPLGNVLPFQHAWALE